MNHRTTRQFRGAAWPVRLRTAGLLLALLLALSACSGEGGGPQANSADTGKPVPQDSASATEDTYGNGSQQPDVPPPAPPEPKHAVLIAVGDVMMHDREIRSGYDPKSRTYDYRSFFADVKPIFAQGDWVTGNLETTLAGEKYGGYTGYPRFNAPPELADALVDAGFNVITNANNHAMDRGSVGVEMTLKHLHERNLLTKGTAADQSEADRALIVEKNGIKLGFLAYTYGTNGIPVPKDRPYLVSLIDEPKMIRDIQSLREQGADLVAVSVHWGYEYHLEPNEMQLALARKLVEAGADFVLGSHPHVVQPYQFIDTKDADGNVRRGLAIYSMGNFISDQTRIFKPFKPTDTGVIFRISVTKASPGSRPTIDDVEAIPTYVDRYQSNGVLHYRILPIAPTIAAKDDPLLSDGDYAKLKTYLDEENKVLQSMLGPAGPQS